MLTLLALAPLLLWPSGADASARMLAAGVKLAAGPNAVIVQRGLANDLPTTRSGYVSISGVNRLGQPYGIDYALTSQTQVTSITVPGPDGDLMPLKIMVVTRISTATTPVTVPTPTPAPIPAPDPLPGVISIPVQKPAAASGIKLTAAGIIQTAWGALARYDAAATTGSQVRILAGTSPKGFIAGAVRVNGALFDAPGAATDAPEWSDWRPVKPGPILVEWILSPSTGVEIDGIEVQPQ